MSSFSSVAWLALLGSHVAVELQIERLNPIGLKPLQFETFIAPRRRSINTL